MFGRMVFRWIEVEHRSLYRSVRPLPLHASETILCARRKRYQLPPGGPVPPDQSRLVVSQLFTCQYCVFIWLYRFSSRDSDVYLHLQILYSIWICSFVKYGCVIFNSQFISTFWPRLQDLSHMTINFRLFCGISKRLTNPQLQLVFIIIYNLPYLTNVSLRCLLSVAIVRGLNSEIKLIIWLEMHFLCSKNI